MGNSKSKSSAKTVKKNIEKYNQTLSNELDAQNKNANNKDTKCYVQIINDIVDIDEYFEANMLLLKKSLLKNIVLASKTGQHHTAVYYGDLFVLNGCLDPFKFALDDINRVAKIIKKLKTYPEMKGYRISDVSVRNLHYGVRITLE